MLKVRVIPTLLWKGVGLVKGVGFDSQRRVGPILPALRVYDQRDVDELILLDVVASQERRPLDFLSLNQFSAEVSVPLSCGGGVASVAHAADLLASGADKVCVNSASYESPQLISDIAARFGVQCVTASIDYRVIDGEAICFSHSGLRKHEIDPVTWARQVAALGAGEILLTSIDRDGAMSGYDLPRIEEVASAVDVPVIASGGAGSYDDLLRALSEAGASAVAAASIFHFTELTPRGAKQFLASRGVGVRVS